MSWKDLFIDVLKAAGDVPAPLSAAAEDAQSCENSAFDESYIDFLDTRGPEWTERLRRRRSGLSPYCGMSLVRGRVRAAASDYSVYVDPTRRVVMYWEEYPLGE